MQNQAFLPSVGSSLSTMTTLAHLDADFDRSHSHSPEREQLCSFKDQSPLTRFYIGDESLTAGLAVNNSTTTSPLVMAKCEEEEMESFDAVTAAAAAALMCESTKRMACQNSFDSGYGIQGYGITKEHQENQQYNHHNRFISCDSEAAIVLNPEATAVISGNSTGSNYNSSGSHDSGCDEDSLAYSGSFSNGTFGQIRLLSVVMQVCLAISLSSAGNFGAGIILDNVQNWTVFHRVPELFYLVPALLGLKGNLEMTMVARLSTLANMGQLNTWKRALRAMSVNISLVQCQAIVIAFLASSVTFLASMYENSGSSTVSSTLPAHMLVQPALNEQNATGASVWIETAENGAPLDVTADTASKVLIIFSTSLATANLACLGSSVFMILMILLLSNLKINPDNFATAIAASIGDIVTSYLLGVIGQFIYNRTVYLPDSSAALLGDLSVRFYQDMRSPSVALGVILFFVVIFPALAYVTCKDEANKRVLFGAGAWCPILVAMMVSFLSGAFLRIGAKYFAFMALFQPLINGVGGNLAAITTSRLSTEMHVQSNARIATVNGHNKVNSRKSVARTFTDTLKAFFKSSDKQNTLMLIFVLIAIVIQLIYGVLLPVQNGHFGDISYVFYLLYCLAASLQVLILLVLTRFLVNIFWYRGMDPDTCAIPLLTSLGDLLGTVFLLSVFYLLRAMGDSSAMPAETSEATLVSSAMAASIDPETVKGVVYATVSSVAAAVSTSGSVLPTTTTTVISSTMATLFQTTTAAARSA
ncbi:hypothetical protein TYRP_015817 [Tyrophagus putrescentiae]|nr:hypothetical protein TYRP_015817 [Tyrophagus putrescentiae]